METKQAESELSFIKKVMEDSRQVAMDNGKYYIFWGVLVSITIIMNYVMIILNVRGGNYYWLVWIVMMFGGGIATTIMKFRDVKKAKVHTFTGRILSSVWLAGGIAMFMIAFVGPAFKAYSYVYINPIISLVLGIMYFVSGGLQQIRWLKYLSLGWWSGAIVLFAFPGIHSMLVFGLMLVFLQTIPGIMLYKKWKKEINPAA